MNIVFQDFEVFDEHETSSNLIKLRPTRDMIDLTSFKPMEHDF